MRHVHFCPFLGLDNFFYAFNLLLLVLYVRIKGAAHEI